MAIKTSNQITLVDLTDAYSVQLTSDAYTFVGNTVGAPSGLTCTTQVVAYCGTTQCPKVSVTVSCPTGVSATIANNDTSMPTITFKTTAVISNTCQATITAAVDGLTINKKFSFAVAKTGATGQAGSAGNGIKSTAVTYQAGANGVDAPTGSWTSSPPVTSADKPYLWSKTVITYTDNTTSTTYSVGSTPEGIVVGGRNLLKLSPRVGGETELTDDGYGIRFNRKNNLDTFFYVQSHCNLDEMKGETVTLSFTCDTDTSWSFGILGDDDNRITLKKGRCEKTFIVPDGAVLGYDIILDDVDIDVTPTDEWVTLTGFKLEKGNKATDWSPAPEDLAMFEEVQNAQKAADEAKKKADEASDVANSTENRVSISEGQIEILNNAIKSIVTDANGSTLMTQTSTGWTFNISGIEKQISDAVGALNNLSGTVGEAKNAISNLDKIVDDVIKKTAYIIMTTDDTGAPCIELGKEGNPFKVRITNTAVDFMQGTYKIAYVNNNSLYIEKAVIKNELQIGDGHGFVWKQRASGNLGLRWV